MSAWKAVAAGIAASAGSLAGLSRRPASALKYRQIRLPMKGGCCEHPPVLVTFTRSETGSTLATISRHDGVIVALPGYDKKHRVPHDLAHFATERHLQLSGGVFGSIASGGMFSNMRVVAGKPRHDAAARSSSVLGANKGALGLAEVMADVVHNAVEHGGGEQKALIRARETWESLAGGPFPWSDQQLTGAIHYLAELAANYQRDSVVQAVWPDSLSDPPPSRSRIKRGRRGRC